MADKDNKGIEIIENADALKKEFFKYEGLLEKNSKTKPHFAEFLNTLFEKEGGA